jgi:hypothetical protein
MINDGDCHTSCDRERIEQQNSYSVKENIGTKERERIGLRFFWEGLLIKVQRRVPCGGAPDSSHGFVWPDKFWDKIQKSVYVRHRSGAHIPEPKKVAYRIGLSLQKIQNSSEPGSIFPKFYELGRDRCDPFPKNHDFFPRAMIECTLARNGTNRSIQYEKK